VKFPAEVKLLRSEVSPCGEVFLANLTSLGDSQTSLAKANFTFAKQKLHQQKKLLLIL
jgi:hypothetical protein